MRNPRSGFYQIRASVKTDAAPPLARSQRLGIQNPLRGLDLLGTKQKMLSLTQTQARQLAIRAQGLHQTQAATPAGMAAVFRQLGCVQLDPLSAVAKSHQLVLRSRLAHADIHALNRDLDQLLWRDKSVFEYWAHCASMVLTEDYPIHSQRMRSYLKLGDSSSSWAQHYPTDAACREDSW